MTEYKKIAPDILRVSEDIGGQAADSRVGQPTLSRIFNFTACQVITLYERGMHTRDYAGNGIYNETCAFTSSMQIHHFSELENQAEIEKMRQKLIDLKGNPPAAPDTSLNKRKMGGGLA